LVAEGVGLPRGIASGQAWECESAVPLSRYHQQKTGALFVAAVMGGALAAGRDPGPWRAMGERLGEAYQVADDLMDVLAELDAGGKPVGQDARHGRPNAALALGLGGAVRRLERLVEESALAVPACAGAAGLRALVRLQAHRLVPAHAALSVA
jgi:geranylgeranyl diphosphate synthase type II